MTHRTYNNKPIPELETSSLRGSNKVIYGKLASLARIEKFSPKVEVWTTKASNKSLSYFSHGIFRYFGKFPPPIARYLIDTYTSPRDLVVDPMCGSGTTALEALLLNRKAACYDVNPLAVLLSNVKIRKLNKSRYLEYLNEVLSSVRKKKVSSNEELVGLKNPSHWFLPETARSLTKIKRAIQELEAPKKYKDAIMIAFLGIVRRVSRATTQQGRLFLDAVTAEQDAIPFFEKKAKSIIEPLSLLPSAGDVACFQESVLERTPDSIIGKADLVICHPPYFNSYKYSGVNSLELSWLGVDHSTIRKDEVRESFKVGKPEKVSEYIADMSKGLKNLKSSLKKNGRLALMIGDTSIREKYIPVTKMLLDELKDDFSVELAAIRVPQFTEASWAASQRRKGGQVGIKICDFIVIMKKL